MRPTASKALLLFFSIALLLLGGCASLPADVLRPPSTALRDTDSTRLGQVSTAKLAANPGKSGFLPLGNGIDAMLARLVLAEMAERSLDVQYYIWHDDLTGRHFANALLRAADRGVRVRVLLDDLGVSQRDETLLSLDAHANVEIRLFNPVASRSMRGLSAMADFERVNRRMHNKSFIADSQAAILGGRNIGDEYFGASGELAFGDLDVLTFGAGVGAVADAFDRYWNAEQAYPVAALLARSGDLSKLATLRQSLDASLAAQVDSPYFAQARERFADKLTSRSGQLYLGSAQLVYDDPGKVSRAKEDTQGHLLPQLAQLHAQAQSELTIVSPYFVPGDKGVNWLRSLAQRGVRVSVLTNSLAATDVGAVHAGYQRYRMPLLEAGVRLYEFKPTAAEKNRSEQESKKSKGGASRASLHAKTFVFDRRTVFIGSLNLDPRSIELNTEIGVLAESSAMAGELADKLQLNIDQIAWRLERDIDENGVASLAWLEANSETGAIQRRNEEPEVSGWRKFSVWLLGLLPIEPML